MPNNTTNFWKGMCRHCIVLTILVSTISPKPYVYAYTVCLTVCVSLCVCACMHMQCACVCYSTLEAFWRQSTRGLSFFPSRVSCGYEKDIFVHPVFFTCTPLSRAGLKAMAAVARRFGLMPNKQMEFPTATDLNAPSIDTSICFLSWRPVSFFFSFFFQPGI